MTIFRVVNTILPKRYHRSLLKFELGVIEQFQRLPVDVCNSPQRSLNLGKRMKHMTFFLYLATLIQVSHIGSSCIP